MNDTQTAGELILYASNTYLLMLLLLVLVAPFFYLIDIVNPIVVVMIFSIPILFLTIWPKRNFTHYMKLTRERLEVYWFGISWIYYWDEVSEFRPYLNIRARSEPVMFQFSPNAYYDGKRAFTPSPDFTTMNAGLYGIGSVELCDLLNLWRRNAFET